MSLNISGFVRSSLARIIDEVLTVVNMRLDLTAYGMVDLEIYSHRAAMNKTKKKNGRTEITSFLFLFAFHNYSFPFEVPNREARPKLAPRFSVNEQINLSESG